MKRLLCFSHLPWNFVYQRPQHLLSRFAKKYQVYYFEEAKRGDADKYEVHEQDGIKIVQLYLGPEDANIPGRLKTLLDKCLLANKISSFDCWYYTPMALEYTAHLDPEITIYDSMDELSAFRFAPPQMITLENELMLRADVVFTGGHTLYQAKKHRHHNIHAFPSSIDKQHFEAARAPMPEPDDQKQIPHPRLGFYGVVDERFDTELLRSVAAERPDWQFVIIGPVVKISEEDLPKADNIHYLGGKCYNDLPQYIGHWDIALILFALNESTKYISPTKTPEYLAAGLPVISTPITDVVNPYGVAGLVQIVDSPAAFIKAAEKELGNKSNGEWLNEVDVFLADNSWDHTFGRMVDLIDNIQNY